MLGTLTSYLIVFFPVKIHVEVLAPQNVALVRNRVSALVISSNEVLLE
jgi:hypothetical protein